MEGMREKDGGNEGDRRRKTEGMREKDGGNEGERERE